MSRPEAGSSIATSSSTSVAPFPALVNSHACAVVLKTHTNSFRSLLDVTPPEKRTAKVSTPPIDVFAYTYDDCGRGFPEEALLRIVSAGVCVLDANIAASVPTGVDRIEFAWDEVCADASEV
jgi:hypothetical protein